MGRRTFRIICGCFIGLTICSTSTKLTYYARRGIERLKSARTFSRRHAFEKHVQEYESKQDLKKSLKTTAVLRSPAQVAADPVRSSGSLAIGLDVVHKGQDKTTLYFPKPFRLFDEMAEWTPEPEGWASKGAAATKTKHVRFTREQIDFLKTTFDHGNNGGHKIRERDAHEQMKKFSARRRRRISIHC